MTDKIQLIKKEIERRIILLNKVCDNKECETTIAYKDILKFIDSLPEEPKCVYNRTLAERKKYCKFCSVACDERIEEPVSEDLEKQRKNML